MTTSKKQGSFAITRDPELFDHYLAKALDRFVALDKAARRSKQRAIARAPAVIGAQHDHEKCAVCAAIAEARLPDFAPAEGNAASTP